MYNDAHWLLESPYTELDYDNNGRLVYADDPDVHGGYHLYWWSDRNQLTRHLHDTLDTHYAWNSAGDLTHVTYPASNATRTLTYRPDGLLDTDRWDTINLQSWRSYDYDADANIISEYI